MLSFPSYILSFHNEIIFFLYIICVSCSSLIFLKIGKEALVALLCVHVICANLFVTKEVTLFGFTATGSDALAVGSVCILNLIQEFFGICLARKTIIISFACSVFYTIASVLHVSYISQDALVSSSFDIILTPMPRIIGASLVTYAIVQHIECSLYGYIKCKLENHFFVLRNYTSVAITQFIDTVLFSFLGLYKATPFYSDIAVIGQIIFISYSIKLIIILLTAPFLSFSQKIMK
jgi:uncharacterized integral membrane protein (TIGR00697 family)